MSEVRTGEFDKLYDVVGGIYEAMNIKGLILSILWNGKGDMTILFLFRDTEKYKERTAYQAVITNEESGPATVEDVRKHVMAYLDGGDEKIYHDDREMTEVERKELKKQGHGFKDEFEYIPEHSCGKPNDGRDCFCWVCAKDDCPACLG